ncbi:PGP [Mytilus coruscus]|uniref:PGP n=1 Tax=Mytilus coruscus TaxID=42192 RepID=A0A6J8BAI4_MYTCO|nr:PGP [Mytilus coruscus]
MHETFSGLELVRKTIKWGKKIFYITNNSGKTRSQYVQKCKSLGFHAAELHEDDKAASYIRKNGTLFVATNEDTHLPLAGDLVVPGTGAVVGAIKIPARKEPVVKEHNLDPARCMMVGDRSDTDIHMANLCGMDSLMVFSGDISYERLQDLQKSADTEDKKLNIPKYYCDKLGDLGNFIQQFI